jgi:hypothetical protein
MEAVDLVLRGQVEELLDERHRKVMPADIEQHSAIAKARLILDVDGG